MKPDIFWIPGPWRGRLAVMTRPRGGDWLGDETAAWRSAGLDTVVSLLEPDEAAQLELTDEASATRSKGIEFISFPISDRSVPTSVPLALSLVEKLSDELALGRNVAVHCRQGIGRSGLIAAAVLMNAGLDAENAIQTVSVARGVQVPETPSQLEWLFKLLFEHPVTARDHQ